MGFLGCQPGSIGGSRDEQMRSLWHQVVRGKGPKQLKGKDTVLTDTSRFPLALIALTLLLTVTGCASNTPVGSGSSASRPPTKAWSVSAFSESTCVGTLTVQASPSAQVQDKKLIIGNIATNPLQISGTCDNRARWEPGLTRWDLQGVIEYTYGRPISSLAAFHGKAAKFGSKAGYSWSYTYAGNSFFELATLVGDDYENVAAEIPTKAVTPAIQSEIQSIFASAQFRITSP